jgi:hypothetical protein
MPGEIVKYRGGELITASAEVEAKIERWRQRRNAEVQRATRQSATSPPCPSETATHYRQPYAPARLDEDGAILDMPRLCARDGGPYIAPYHRENGIWRLSEMKVVTKTIWQLQYEGNPNIGFLPVDALEHETCPRCGAHGGPRARGPLYCGRCGAAVCYGRTVGNAFRCCCGNVGKISGNRYDPEKGMAISQYNPNGTR